MNTEIKMVPLPVQQWQGDNRSGQPVDQFAEWNDESAVEVGASNNADAANKAAGGDEPEEKPKRPLSGAAKTAAEAKAAREAEAAAAPEPSEQASGEEGDEGGEGNEGGEENSGQDKGRAVDRIKEMTRRTRLAERELQRVLAENEALKKGTGQQAPASGNSQDIGAAPDPTDSAKYPLGHLDDRYVEDKLEWLAKDMANKAAENTLREQREQSAQAVIEAQQTVIQNQIDDLTDRGVDLDPDYETNVVKTAMAGEWKLTKETFEAAHEVDHGAEILLNLSKDKAEAERVHNLSVRQQIIYVNEKNDEIAAKRKVRTKPRDQQGVPTQTRGVGSKTKIDPATDDLGEFEELWKQG